MLLNCTRPGCGLAAGRVPALPRCQAVRGARPCAAQKQDAQTGSQVRAQVPWLVDQLEQGPAAAQSVGLLATKWCRTHLLDRR